MKGSSSCSAVTLPAFVEARVESGSLTQLNPAEFRADLVLSLIIGCSDLEALTRWHRRAITATSTDELFD